MMMQPRKVAERTQTVWTLGSRTVQTTVRLELDKTPPYRAYYFIHEDGGTSVREAEVKGRFETFEAAQEAALQAAQRQIMGLGNTAQDVMNGA